MSNLGCHTPVMLRHLLRNARSSAFACLAAFWLAPRTLHAFRFLQLRTTGLLTMKCAVQRSPRLCVGLCDWRESTGANHSSDVAPLVSHWRPRCLLAGVSCANICFADTRQKVPLTAPKWP